MHTRRIPALLVCKENQDIWRFFMIHKASFGKVREFQDNLNVLRILDLILRPIKGFLGGDCAIQNIIDCL